MPKNDTDAIGSMERDEALRRCMVAVGRLASDQQLLRERVTELEIQNRFLMGAVLMKHNTAGSILQPGQQPFEIVDAHTFYVRHGGREATLAILEAEYHTSIVAERVMEMKANGDTRPNEEIISEVQAAYAAELAARDQGDSGQHPTASDGTATGTKTTAH